jgi:hypothetical protein
MQPYLALTAVAAAKVTAHWLPAQAATVNMFQGQQAEHLPQQSHRQSLVPALLREISKISPQAQQSA